MTTARQDPASGPDAVSLLEAASLLVPADIATENDITVNDVWEYLAHDEWEVALAGSRCPAPPVGHRTPHRDR
ncbi:hypothetical protein [Streptomyces atriruber]|uniref:hypothetical protein n=1 Tax=Streptomyces atriruber TaxID=545121 RepID=UPI003F53F7D5